MRTNKQPSKPVSFGNFLARPRRLWNCQQMRWRSWSLRAMREVDEQLSWRCRKKGALHSKDFHRFPERMGIWNGGNSLFLVKLSHFAFREWTLGMILERLGLESWKKTCIIHHDTLPTIMAGCSGSAHSRLSKRRGSLISRRRKKACPSRSRQGKEEKSLILHGFTNSEFFFWHQIVVDCRGHLLGRWNLKLVEVDLRLDQLDGPDDLQGILWWNDREVQKFFDVSSALLAFFGSAPMRKKLFDLRLQCCDFKQMNDLACQFLCISIPIEILNSIYNMISYVFYSKLTVRHPATSGLASVLAKELLNGQHGILVLGHGIQDVTVGKSTSQTQQPKGETPTSFKATLKIYPKQQVFVFFAAFSKL